MEHNNETIQFLQYLIDAGPAGRSQIVQQMGVSANNCQSRVDYCRTQGLIIGTPQSGERGFLYSVSDAGRRRLRLESGQIVPPRTIAYKPWAPVRELEWPSVRPGANDFLQHETRGYA
jgi:hypothetical protein